MGLSEKEAAALVRVCGDLPPARRPYVQTDYILNLFLAVLDYRSTAEAVRAALGTYRERWWDKIRNFDDLKRFLARYPDTPEGNLKAGSDLWGFRAARRVGELRGLVKFFEARGVVTQELLVHWARTSQYRDFMGRVKGLSLNVYEGMQLRLGYGTIKATPHLTGFFGAVLGRQLSEHEVREAVDKVSGRLGIRPRELDRRIYEVGAALSQSAPRGQSRPAEPAVPKSKTLGVQATLLGSASR